MLHKNIKLIVLKYDTSYDDDTIIFIILLSDGRVMNGYY